MMMRENGKLPPPKITNEEMDEVVKNVIQLLYLIYKTEKIGYTGITKIQKLTFLAEYLQRTSGIDGFSFKFFRWEYGPMSKEIYENLELLEKNGLIFKRYGNYQLSERGREIINELNPIIKDNFEVFDLIEKVVEEFGRKSANSLKNYIYMNFKVGEVTLSNVDLGVDLIMPRPRKFKRRLEIPEDWLATFELYLNKEIKDSLNNALESARKHRMKKFEGL